MKIKSVGINLVSKLCSKISLCIIIALKIIQKKHPMEKKKSSISFGALMKAPLSGTIKFPTMGINHAGVFILSLNQKLITYKLKISCKALAT